MNSITMIMPYKSNGMWMFDDANHGLKGELFVAGADEMLEAVAAKIPDAESGFRLIFSPTPFPGFQIKLDWLREDPDVGGNWYRWDGVIEEGWLCPAMFHYFDAAPANIYIKAEHIANQTSTV